MLGIKISCRSYDCKFYIYIQMKFKMFKNNNEHWFLFLILCFFKEYLKTFFSIFVKQKKIFYLFIHFFCKYLLRKSREEQDKIYVLKTNK